MRTCADPGRDRLAVWTYEEAGEEIPSGDPWVTRCGGSSSFRSRSAGCSD